MALLPCLNCPRQTLGQPALQAGWWIERDSWTRRRHLSASSLADTWSLRRIWRVPLKREGYHIPDHAQPTVTIMLSPLTSSPGLPTRTHEGLVYRHDSYGEAYKPLHRHYIASYSGHSQFFNVARWKMRGPGHKVTWKTSLTCHK